MAKISARNLLLLIHKRFLKTSATISATTLLPTKSSSPASPKSQLIEKQGRNIQSIVEFFKSHGFSNTHVAKVIAKRPELLTYNVEKSIKPKIEFLNKNGFVGESLADLLVSNSAILTRALDSVIKPNFEFLKSFLGSEEKIIVAIKRSTWLLSSNVKSVIKLNVDFLIKEGLSKDNIAKLILLQPRVIMQRHDKVVYVVNAVKNLSIDPKNAKFIHCVRVMGQMNNSTWKKKMELFKSLGCSEEQFFYIFRRCPQCLGCSEENIRKKMDFYMKTMKLDLEIITTYPIILSYSIDKTVHPRYNVFKVLESKKLIRTKFMRLLVMSEKKFLENYVLKYVDEVPALLEMYDGARKHKDTSQ